jgi:hypothetical protein
MNKNLFMVIAVFMLLSACQVVKPATEIAVLADVQKEYDYCKSADGILTDRNLYSLNCNVSADSGYMVSISRFESEAEAQAQFEIILGDNPVLCFHGYDLYELISKNPNNPFIMDEQRSWRAGKWLVSTEKYYDTGYAHSSGRGFEEDVYDSAIAHGLFPAGTCPGE